ncbi:hypothetical protein PBCV1_A050aL [Paramecium bursaria Chlorella virus 1]|uniref:Uncharacterized protein n=1 Tax=Paramecium bursaria Chlorella virus 1 TaxID=10506 RepID=F8TTW2_PBCV1|nr:hypothetical protein PBCV1_A050aL [Paramecium bursaria Chlorella virus 1]AEI70023.1 hypothetical protein [Paramecium bursaria Chlorella virus 1]
MYVMDIIGTIAVSFLVSYLYNIIYRPPKIIYYEYSPLPVSYPCKFP